MAHNPAMEIASAIQSATIQHDPSPEHDIAPSTSVDTRIPADLVSPDHSRSASLSSASSTVPSEVAKPRRRTRSFPPIPEMRFEQSYLASIKNADTNWKIAYITIKDQVLLPLVQGVLWNTIMLGWRYSNRGSTFAGKSLGARIRKWWWEVNNWKAPSAVENKRQEFARGAKDFYTE